MENKSAQNIYYWLWFSPILTIPTLGLFLEVTDSDTTAILISAVWHLFLFLPATNLKKRFMAWHARQALLLVGVRTLIVLVFHNEPILAFILLALLWFFGTRWGQKEAKKGQCSLMRWQGAYLEGQTLAKEKKKAKPSTTAAAVSVPKKILKPSGKPLKPSPLPSCPKCGTPEKEKETICGECGETYAAEDLLKLRQLEYLLRQTQTWRGSEPYRKIYKAELQRLRARLFPPQQVEIKDEEPRRAQPEPAPVKKAVAEPKPIPAKAVVAAVAEPAIKVEKTAPKPKPVIKKVHTARKEKPVLKPKPAPKPKPKRDPIQWAQLWEKAIEMVVSGALLRGLLYLGAFMIVISATILVVRFWDEFPRVLQLILIAAVPTTFYILSWVVRSKLKLPQAATVLTAIGALMVAVDFAAVYQFGGLSERFDGNAYWLFASVISLIIYSITAWRVSGEIFDYLVLIGITSVVLSFTRLLGIPYEWSAVVMVATGVALFAFAVSTKVSHPSGGDFRRTEGGRGGIARASRYYPHLLIIASLIFVSYIPNASAWAQSFAFLLGTLGYALMAWKFPKTIFAHATVWAFIVAVGFALFAMELPTAWYATAAGILAIPYILGGKFMESFTSEKEKSWQRGYQLAANIAGFGLTSLSILLGLAIIFVEPWAGIVALNLATFILVGSAYLFKRPIFVFLASVLFIVPFQQSLEISTLPEHVHSLAYILLASLVYMPIGNFLAYSRKYQKEPRFEYPTLIIGYLMSVFALFTSILGRFDIYSVNYPLIGVEVPLIASALYFYSIYRYKKNRLLSEFFSAFSAIAFAIAFGQSLTLFQLPKEYLATAWIGLAFVYLLIERGIAPLKAESWLKNLRLSYGIGSAILAIAGFILTMPYAVPALLGGEKAHLFLAIFAQTLTVGFVILAARLYRSSLPLYLEPFIAFFPLTLIFIAYTEITTFQLGVVWAVFALIHLVIATLLDMTEESVPSKGADSSARYARGIYLGSYFFSLFAISWTFLDFATLVWTLGLGILGAVASALSVHFNQHRTWGEVLNFLFRKKDTVLYKAFRAIFVWVIAWTFPLWLMLVFNNIANTSTHFIWLGFGISGLLFIALALWLEDIETSYTVPFHLAGQFYILIGVLVTLPFTVKAFQGKISLTGNQSDGLAAILLQWLAVGYYALFAWALRKRKIYYIFPYIASALAFIPYTLGWVFYSRQILQHALTQAEFGIVWGVLALAMLALAVDRDQPARSRGVVVETEKRLKYAHGLYFTGYGIITFALLWTLSLQKGMMLSPLFWVLSLGLIISIASAILTHLNLHHTWDDLLRVFFKSKESELYSIIRSLFIRITVWVFPLWVHLLLRQFEIIYALTWLGYVLSALLLLGLAVWIRKIDKVYATPFYLASQFYIIYALLVSRGFFVTFWQAEKIAEKDRLTALAIVILQSVAVIFYAASAWVFYAKKSISSRASFGEAVSDPQKGIASAIVPPHNAGKFKLYYIFSYIASALAFFPYTLAWDLYSPPATYPQYAWAWMGLAGTLLLFGYLLDRGWQVKVHARYAHGAYFVGYALIALSIYQSASEYLSGLYTLGGAILLTLISQLLVHYKKHHAFADFIDFWWRKKTILRRVAQTFFLFFAVYTMPVWLVQLLTYNQVELARRGFILALLAPAYLAMGLVARRARREYTWAFFSAGYALTVIGAMIAFNDLKMAIAVLVLDAAVYAVSAYIFKEALWLYLTTILVPIISLLSLHYTDNLNASPVSKIFMGMAFLYLLIGWIFDNQVRPHLPKGGKISAFALPFYAPAFALSTIAIATASSERSLAILIYLLGVLFYIISIKLFDKILFLYPAVWLFAVPYYLLMTLIPNLDARWYGLGWLPLIIFYILIGRFVFHKKPIKSPILAHPAMPFYLLGYALSLSLVALSATDSLAFTLAFATGAILYFVSSGMFRKPAWFYPGLLFVHLALLNYFTINPSEKTLHRLNLSFMGLTWAMALVGYAFSRIARSKGFSPYFEHNENVKALRTKVKFIDYLLTPSWAQPFFVFSALYIFLWQVVAHPDSSTAIILAMGHALLLALFAILWVDSALVYGAFVFFLLAVGYQLSLAEVAFAESMAWFGGIGFGFYLLSRVSKQVEKRTRRCAIWTNPFKKVGGALSAFAVIISIPFLLSHTSASALSFAFAGMLYLAIAYEDRRYYLGYLGMAMLLFSWVLLLVARDILEPQLYAIPAGFYFTVMGELERRRGRSVFSKIITGFGLAVLLVTSYVQSLGNDGFVYFVILLVEGLLVWWWGAARRQKVPFFVGLGVSALNVISQVILVVRVYDINRWIAILGVGLVLVVAAIFVEKQRETIIARSKEWSEKLDSWE